MAKIVINAGHTKFAPGTGANGKLNESKEVRRIAYHLMELLVNTNHEIIPAVFDKSDNNLKDAVELSNNNFADLFISIHLNAGGGNGVEVYTWKGAKLPLATRICENISKIGFRNRGIKDGSKLYVIRNTDTRTEALLVECCFVDSAKDYQLYDYKEIAEAIAKAIKEEEWIKQTY